VLSEGEGGRREGESVEEVESRGRVNLERSIDGGREYAGNLLAVAVKGQLRVRKGREKRPHLRNRNSSLSQLRFGNTPRLTTSTLELSRTAVLTLSGTVPTLSSFSWSRRGVVESASLARERRAEMRSSTTSVRL
jgi:hypothetical protein